MESHITDKEVLTQMAKEAYKLKQQIAELTGRHTTLMDNLKLAAGGSEGRWGNYKLSFTVRPGSVDYTAIPELKTINLDMYRKPGVLVSKLEFLGE
jgi:hypothetical protein